MDKKDAVREDTKGGVEFLFKFLNRVDFGDIQSYIMFVDFAECVGCAYYPKLHCCLGSSVSSVNSMGSTENVNTTEIYSVCVLQSLYGRWQGTPPEALSTLVALMIMLMEGSLQTTPVPVV